MGNETCILGIDEIGTGRATYCIVRSREDLTSIFPGMFRYCVSLIADGRVSVAFRTNTFEYASGVPHGAEEVSKKKMDELRELLHEDPGPALSKPGERRPVGPMSPAPDVVILQGSPRADGNCGSIASWARDIARDRGKTASVVYPHDMDLHFCIGCYQCFNTGTCTFNDDMAEILSAISRAELVVICSPVYTNTVPAGLKAVFDRALPIYASLTLGMEEHRPKGLLFSVAGRKGMANFTCTRRVVRAFMEISAITPSGELLFDDMDCRRRIQDIENAESGVKALVGQALGL
jgi:multimeric flavodoxin WrbA